MRRKGDSKGTEPAGNPFGQSRRSHLSRLDVPAALESHRKPVSTVILRIVLAARLRLHFLPNFPLQEDHVPAVENSARRVHFGHGIVIDVLREEYAANAGSPSQLDARPNLLTKLTRPKSSIQKAEGDASLLAARRERPKPRQRHSTLLKLLLDVEVGGREVKVDLPDKYDTVH
jgi:hypothetical protein